MIPLRQPLGATPLGDGTTRMRVWAPNVDRVEVHLIEPLEIRIAMEKTDRGHHEIVSGQIEEDALYFFRLDDRDFPDPASRFQPRGVHGPSQVMTREFPWRDKAWNGLALDRYVFYELHVGTYTPSGGFDEIIAHLDRLATLGITAIELMPIAQFPGERNWGYDGVSPFAVQASYGGPLGLKRLVDAAHARGLAVVLDVVYNHLGPEGNYVSNFGPYYTKRYTTPWGPAINFDGAGSDEVREFFIQNALMWIEEFHIDALRLDAIHAIADQSARPFLRELGSEIRIASGTLGRRIHMIAETNLNDPRVIQPPARGGFGFDAQWNDDFHHALHTLLTGERSGYYADYHGIDDLVTVLNCGYLYQGQYSKYRQRRFGSELSDCDTFRLVVFGQNHDQIGNRMIGERLASTLTFEQLRLVAAAVILSPFLPMLFMGEEYGEPAPFPFFTSHGDPELIDAVRNGRKQEFASFGWTGDPPDPQAEATFASARLDHAKASGGLHRTLFEWHEDLFRLRREHPALRSSSFDQLEAVVIGDAIRLHRWRDQHEICIVLGFSERPASVSLPHPSAQWKRILSSDDPRWSARAIAETVAANGRHLEREIEIPAWGVAVYEKL